MLALQLHVPNGCSVSSYMTHMRAAVLHAIPHASYNTGPSNIAACGTTACPIVVCTSHAGVLVCRSPSEDQAHQLSLLLATALLCWTREATRL